MRLTDAPSIANSPDFAAVYVCFEDEMIAYLFSCLIEGRGLRSFLVASPDECREGFRIITESKFYPKLAPEQRRRCLIVSNQDGVRVPGINLSRPLTEDKIEAAFSKFLDLTE